MNETDIRSNMTKIASLIWASDDDEERAGLKLQYDYWRAKLTAA